MVVHSDRVLERSIALPSLPLLRNCYSGWLIPCSCPSFIGIGNTKVTTWTTGVMVAVKYFFSFSTRVWKPGFSPHGDCRCRIIFLACRNFRDRGDDLLFVQKKNCPSYSLFHFVKLKLSLLRQMIKLSLPLVFQQLISVGSWEFLSCNRTPG